MPPTIQFSELKFQMPRWIAAIVLGAILASVGWAISRNYEAVDKLQNRVSAVETNAAASNQALSDIRDTLHRIERQLEKESK